MSKLQNLVPEGKKDPMISDLYSLFENSVYVPIATILQIDFLLISVVCVFDTFMVLKSFFTKPSIVSW